MLACLEPEQVVAFIDGSIDGDAAGTIEQHLDACGTCRLLVVEAARAQFPVAPTSVTLPAGDAPSSSRFEPPSLPGYRVETLVSYGGLGAVWRAIDLRLDRVVALKQLRRRDPDAEARFSREAAITARLQHPSIVPVYEAGRGRDGEPFYAMKLIEGRTLAEALAAAPSLAERMALLPRVLAAARALAYAHDRGVVHRDVKPANIVLGAYGETIVVDWGLAKELGAVDAADAPSPSPTDGDPGATQLGTVLGTPSYMPPEQAAGQPVDARADVYALGAVLYQLLTGTAPHDAASVPERLQALAAGPPAPVGALQSGVPRELASLVQKAMARDPAGRFTGAAAFADELERFTTGQLVGVHHYSLGELAARFVRRHAGVVATGALAAILLVVVGVAALRNVERARRMAEDQRDSLYVAQAESAIAVDPTAALAWLARYPVDGADWRRVRAVASEAFVVGVARWALPMSVPSALDARDAAVVWVEPDRAVRLALATGARHEVPLPAGRRALGWAADARALFLVGEEGAVVRLAGATGAPAVVCRDDALARGDVEVAPDGRWVAVTGRDDRLRLCDVARGAVRVPALPSGVGAVAFSADGRRIAVAGNDGAIRWWPLDDAAATPRPLIGHAGAASVVRFSADGARLLSAGYDGSVRVWPLDGGAPRILRTSGGPVYSASWPDDARRVAYADGDKSVRLWELDTNTTRVVQRGERSIYEVRFARDGKRLAWGDGSLLRIADVKSGEQQLLRGHGVEIGDLGFSDDGRWLRSWSLDGESRVWDLGAVGERVLARAAVGATWVDLAPDGQRFVAAWRDGALRLCRVDGAAPCRALPGHASRVWKVKFTPDGRFIVSVGDDAAVRVWVAARDESRALAGHTGPVSALNVSADSRWAVTAGDDGSARLWDLAAGRGRVLAPPAAQIRAVNFSADGRRVVLGGADGLVTLVDVDGGGRRTLTGRRHGISSIELSRDGRTVAASSSSDSVEITLWSLDDGRARALVGHDKAPSAIRFSPDGTLLASAGYDGSVRLWRVADGSARVLAGHRAGVGKLAFTDDGRRLFTGANDGTVRVWDVATGEGRVIGRHDGAVFALAVAPDGAGAVGAITDGTVRWWPATGSSLPLDAGAAHRALADWARDAPTHRAF